MTANNFGAECIDRIIADLMSIAGTAQMVANALDSCFNASRDFADTTFGVDRVGVRLYIGGQSNLANSLQL